MFHFFGTVNDDSGNSLVNWQVEAVLVDTTDTVAIFSDENGTPISASSGIDDRAVSDAQGNYDFFVPDGTYSLRFYNAEGVLQKTQRYMPMYGNASDTVVTAVADARAAQAASEAAATQSAASAALAQGYAATIGSAVPVYATVADGIAGVADGLPFDVPQASGDYHFRYTRIGSEAQFDGPVARSSAAATKEADIIAAIEAYADAPSDGILLITKTADRMGGRGVENVLSGSAWTLNVVDSFYLRDEEGNTTPTRTISASVDPLGNTEAMALTFNNANHNLEQVNKGDDAGMGTHEVTLSLKIRSDTSTETIGIGSTSRTAGAYFSGALTTSWQAVGGTVSGYSPAAIYDLGILPDSGAATPIDCDIFANFVGFDSGPLVVPSDATLRAETLSGHAKAALGRPGAITIDGEGWIVSGNTYFDNVVVNIGRPALSEYALMCWVDFAKADYASGSYTIAAAFGNTPDTGTSTLLNECAIGMDANTAVDGRYGRLYVQPAQSQATARSPGFILDQGPVHIAVSVKRNSGTDCTCTYYINGVPLDEAPVIVDELIYPEIIHLLGNQNSRKRRQVGLATMTDGDRIGDVHFLYRPVSDSEVSASYLAGKSTLARNGVKSMLVIGSFDSLTEFADAPFWDSMANASLRPGTHAMLDARGGSRFGSGAENAYDNVDRQGIRRRALAYGAKHHDRVIWLCHFGTNDMVSGVMDPTNDPDNPINGSRTIDAMIAADIASVPEADRSKIKTVLMPPPPRGDWVGADATADDTTRANALIAYRADCLANFAARGYDYVLDWTDYIPAGHASLEAAAKDAYDTSTDNGIVKNDGIHWDTAGGAGASAAVTVPFLQSQLAEIQA